jgi:hypothetical protein
LNLSDLRAEVQAHGFTMTTTARIDRWLNEAYITVARRARLAQFETTQTLAFSSGTPSIALPSNVGTIVSVTVASTGQPLGRLTGALVDTQVATGAGAPLGYYLSGGNIVIFPQLTAATNVTLRYFAEPTLLSGTGDVPNIPVAYHDLLVAYAVSRGYRQEDDPQQAAAFMGDFDRRLAEMIVSERAENIDGPKQVPGMWASAPATPWGN